MPRSMEPRALMSAKKDEFRRRLSTLNRLSIQKFAKEHGVKANVKTSLIVEKLADKLASSDVDTAADLLSPFTTVNTVSSPPGSFLTDDELDVTATEPQKENRWSVSMVLTPKRSPAPPAAASVATPALLAASRPPSTSTPKIMVTEPTDDHRMHMSEEDEPELHSPTETAPLATSSAVAETISVPQDDSALDTTFEKDGPSQHNTPEVAPKSPRHSASARRGGARIATPVSVRGRSKSSIKKAPLSVTQKFRLIHERQTAKQPDIWAEKQQKQQRAQTLFGASTATERVARLAQPKTPKSQAKSPRVPQSKTPHSAAPKRALQFGAGAAGAPSPYSAPTAPPPAQIPTVLDDHQVPSSFRFGSKSPAEFKATAAVVQQQQTKKQSSVPRRNSPRLATAVRSAAKTSSQKPPAASRAPAVAPAKPKPRPPPAPTASRPTTAAPQQRLPVGYKKSGALPPFVDTRGWSDQRLAEYKALRAAQSQPRQQLQQRNTQQQATAGNARINRRRSGQRAAEQTRHANARQAALAARRR